jgi:hypothetical protein
VYYYSQFVEALEMMNKKFANPYIIYYPVVSHDGMPFPINRTVRDIQEEVNKSQRLREDQLWRGNLVAAKFTDNRFTQMTDASMADFPILKNFLGTHPFPSSATGPLPTMTMAASPTTTAHPTHPSPHPLRVGRCSLEVCRHDRYRRYQFLCLLTILFKNELHLACALH